MLQTIETHKSIRQALIFLSSACDGASSIDGQGFNKMDSEWGHRLAYSLQHGYEMPISEQQETLKRLKKYKKQLQRASIELPTQGELMKFCQSQECFEVARTSDIEWTVENLLKGTRYEVTALGNSEILQCDCPINSLQGRECKHILEVRKVQLEELAELNQVEIEEIEEWEPDTTEYSSELATCEFDEYEDDEYEDEYDWYEPGDLEREDYIKDIKLRKRAGESLFLFDEIALDSWDPNSFDPTLDLPVIEAEPVPDEEILPGITLNEDQKQALSDISKWLDSQERSYLLTGGAGRGKSTVLQALISLLRRYGDRRSIVFTAPTNKAVKVLQKMVRRWNLDIECMTCHKLLALKPVKREKRLEFVPDPKQEAVFDNYRLVVIDEASMLNESMWYLLNDACTFGQKLLFVGDKDQAPPIGEPKAKPFAEVGDRSTSTLSQMMRFTGAIGRVTEAAREAIEPATVYLPTFETEDEGETGVWNCDKKTWEYNLLRAFKAEEYKSDPDWVRAVVYSNKRADALNQKVRDAIYGGDMPQFIVGERLIAHEAYSQNETVIIPTSEEGTVLSANWGSIGNWEVWFLQLRLDAGEIVTVPVLKQEEQAKYTQKLNALAESKRWSEYWDLREAFAELRYPFVITSHKAQGSTYRNVYVDMVNFTSTFAWIVKGKAPAFQKQKIQERNQLLYTAMSRASHKLFLYQ